MFTTDFGRNVTTEELIVQTRQNRQYPHFISMCEDLGAVLRYKLCRMQDIREPVETRTAQMLVTPLGTCGLIRTHFFATFIPSVVFKVFRPHI